MERNKYRIWAEKEKKMYYHDTKNNDFVINCHGQVIKIGYAGDRAGQPLFVFEKLDESYKVLQCLGVKYQDGVYEGDIVKITHVDVNTGEPISEKKCSKNREVEFRDMANNICPKGSSIEFTNWDYIEDGVYVFRRLEEYGILDIYLESIEGEGIDHNILLSELENSDFKMEILGNIFENKNLINKT